MGNNASLAHSTDTENDVTRRGPSQKTLLISMAVLGAIALALSNKKEGEVTPSAPINQVKIETLETNRQETESEKDTREMERVRALFEEAEQQK